MKELMELVQLCLPDHMSVSLHETRTCSSPELAKRLNSRHCSKPRFFQHNGSFIDAVHMTEPLVVEIRAYLSMGDNVGWWLPVHFCIDELLRAHELITQIDDAFGMLESWSNAKMIDESTWSDLPPVSASIQ
jgi:hypothetical protein